MLQNVEAVSISLPALQGFPESWKHYVYNTELCLLLAAEDLPVADPELLQGGL